MNLDKTIKKGVGQFRGMSADIESMEQLLTEICNDAGELSEGLQRINSSGGKRFRPMLAWICWRMVGAKSEIVPLMCMLELMHTASLIHDDIVDNADMRRGAVTINKQSGIQTAIRSGDYLLARAMEFLKVYRGTGINEALSRVSELMCDGELRQQDRMFRIDSLTEAVYRDYIFGKTAAFIAESCRCGAVAGGATAEEAQSILEYGTHLGMAFQMRDDYLDWVPDAGTGKTPLQDLRSGVMTLPVILSVTGESTELNELLKNDNKTEEEIQSIFQLVSNSGALYTAEGYMKKESDMAVEALKACPGGTERNALIQLAKSITEVK